MVFVGFYINLLLKALLEGSESNSAVKPTISGTHVNDKIEVLHRNIRLFSKAEVNVESRVII